MQTRDPLPSGTEETPSDLQHGNASDAVCQSVSVSATQGLIDTTEALAKSCMTERVETVGVIVIRSVYCRECFRSGLGGTPTRHASSCVVGQALFAAALLRASMNGEPSAGSESEAQPLPPFVRGPGKSVFGGGILGSLATTLSPAKTRMEQNFFAGPVRTIEYDTAEDDMGEGLDCAAPLTHEEAASERQEVFGEAAK